MNDYNRVNVVEDTEQGILGDDEPQMTTVSNAAAPLWPNSNVPCIVSNNKIGDTTPTSPGTYYATIQSTASSRRYIYLQSFTHTRQEFSENSYLFIFFIAVWSYWSVCVHSVCIQCEIFFNSLTSNNFMQWNIFSSVVFIIIFIRSQIKQRQRHRRDNWPWKSSASFFITFFLIRMI